MDPSRSPMARERENFLYIAELADLADRYDEMVAAMKSVVRLDAHLTLNERNMLSNAYKNAISPRRASFRILALAEEKEAAKGNEHRVNLIRAYRQNVETELYKICCDIVDLVNEHFLLPSATGEPYVFYHKMKGDYYRYLAETKIGIEKHEAIMQCLDSYETASKAAATDLSPIDQTRLCLALNHSVFYYDIMNSPERACKLAKQAFDEAISELDTLGKEECHKESTVIMQLLKENLVLWTSNIPKDEEDNTKDSTTAGPSGSAGEDAE